MYDSAFLCRGERKNKQEALEVRKVLSGSESHYSVISQSECLCVCRHIQILSTQTKKQKEYRNTVYNFILPTVKSLEQESKENKHVSPFIHFSPSSFKQ